MPGSLTGFLMQWLYWPQRTFGDWLLLRVASLAIFLIVTIGAIVSETLYETSGAWPRGQPLLCRWS